MIDKTITKNINYTMLHRKSRGELDLDENIKKQMQIEKIKNVFRDSDKNEKNNNDNEKINNQIFNYDYNSKNIEPFKNLSLIKNSIGNDNIESQYKNKIEKIFNYDYKSKDIEPFNNFSLIKNSIGTDNIEPQYKNKIEKLLSSKKNNKYNINKEREKVKDNLIIDYETENTTDTNKIEKNKNENESNKNNIFNDNIFNITQDQMKIFDNGVNKLYNDHKNNIKLKIFQINHPYLHNIKLINNKIESTSSSMTKKKEYFLYFKNRN